MSLITKLSGIALEGFAGGLFWELFVKGESFKEAFSTDFSPEGKVAALAVGGFGLLHEAYIAIRNARIKSKVQNGYSLSSREEKIYMDEIM